MYENKKISKIVDEVITYLLDKNATDIQISIEKNENYAIIHSTSQNVELSEIELKELKDFLNSTHREAETEEYYWSLAGENRCSQELSLVAIMVDVAEIYYADKELKMDFLRKSKR